jgi:uncharacterized protein YuzE
MANLVKEPPFDLPMPKFEDVDSKQFSLVYDKKHDTLFIRRGAPRPGTSIDLEGEAWLRMDPRTGEILGFEIEDFERVFLPRHPDIASAWHEANDRGRLFRRRTESLLAIIIDFIRRFLDVHPQQPRLCAP